MARPDTASSPQSRTSGSYQESNGIEVTEPALEAQDGGRGAAQEDGGGPPLVASSDILSSPEFAMQ